MAGSFSKENKNPRSAGKGHFFPMNEGESMSGNTPGFVSKDKKEVKLAQIGLGLVVTTLTHPVEYAKFLIQVGYEPLSPHSSNIFWRPTLFLPNVLEYVLFIKKTDGVIGCFRGFSAKLCANFINGATFETVKESIHFESDIKSLISEDDIDPDSERKQKYVNDCVKELIARTVAVITSHPFKVIAGRMMAEFVGRDYKYNTLLDSIREIYRHNGIGGFFSGLVPRLIGDLLSVCILTSCTYLIHVYCTDDQEMRNYCSIIIGFFASSFTHPFHVVSNCMILTNSGLAAGSPPRMPEYKSWMQCWRHLKSTNQIKRGSSLFFRAYTDVGAIGLNKF